MLNEQQKLLYDIAKNHLDYFYLNMKDSLTIEDHEKLQIYEDTIKKLEKEYMSKYTGLPQWKYIDDIMYTYDELKKLIEGEEE